MPRSRSHGQQGTSSTLRRIPGHQRCAPDISRGSMARAGQLRARPARVGASSMTQRHPADLADTEGAEPGGGHTDGVGQQGQQRASRPAWWCFRTGRSTGHSAAGPGFLRFADAQDLATGRGRIEGLPGENTTGVEIEHAARPRSWHQGITLSRARRGKNGEQLGPALLLSRWVSNAADGLPSWLTSVSRGLGSRQMASASSNVRTMASPCDRLRQLAGLESGSPLIAPN